MTDVEVDGVTWPSLDRVIRIFGAPDTFRGLKINVGLDKPKRSS